MRCLSALSRSVPASVISIQKVSIFITEINFPKELQPNKRRTQNETEIHSHRTVGRNCDHHYPAGAEFLTFVYSFFLIIKYL